MLDSDPGDAENLLVPLCHDSRLSPLQRADAVRLLCRARLAQDKTYMTVDGIGDAIVAYSAAKDTARMIEMYQLAAIRMGWRCERDSAEEYLLTAVELAGQGTAPVKAALYRKLSNLMAYPTMNKDYAKALNYARQSFYSLRPEDNRARALHDIGLFHAFRNDNDSALLYLEQAVEASSPSDAGYATYALNYANTAGADFNKCRKFLGAISGENLGKLLTLGYLYLNRQRTDSASYYLAESRKLYDRYPENYSINTFNSLRMLEGYVDYALTGNVSPSEGTVGNDSVSIKTNVMRKLEAELSANNSALQIRLLENRNRTKTIWIWVISLLATILSGAAWIYWNGKRRYLRIRKELDDIRIRQIMADDKEKETEAGQTDILRQKAALCMEAFRSTGVLDAIQCAELDYRNNGSYMTAKERMQLQQKLLESFSDLIVDLRALGGRMSVDDIMTALLSYMRMTNAAISASLGVSEGAVRTRKSRLRSKFPPDLSALLFGQHNQE